MPRGKFRQDFFYGYSSQEVTPDCLVRARNTGQVRTGGGRAVPTAKLAEGRKKIVVCTQREQQDE